MAIGSEIIKYYGYPCQDHTVTTEDGFILSLQRIPGGNIFNSSRKNPLVVFLQHGLLCSSTSWVMNMRNQSLGFILADMGFDVWLGNSRGSTYSMKHAKYFPNQSKFWDWSWDHMAQYDFPAVLSYILTVTKQISLYYIGHSQGTLIAFSALSSRNYYNGSNYTREFKNLKIFKNIKLFIALSPVAYLGHIHGPLKAIAKLPVSQEILEFFLGKDKDFLPQNNILKWLNKMFCDKKRFEVMCSNILFLICGPDITNLNKSRIPVYFAHYPAGTSVQNMIHYIQAVKSKKYQKFDYGIFKNKEIYNQFKPPQYDISKMSEVPVHLFTGSEDWLSTMIDVNIMKAKLKNFKQYNYPSYNHLDFIWGENAPSRVYNVIIDILKKDINNNKS
ncbi:lysosomal acid lipase/cholesteryl ester hydrolase-like isoform X2 [Gordionus sp. m RMFG-2023]|uniref:lysosomal acid lipase/cholesteryl ester hydrolase-like isoform X2 n=1 Tax=Gordionus sp. m RMFG-2023 TaxID=3053472 RepID=UPI0031FD494E